MNDIQSQAVEHDNSSGADQLSNGPVAAAILPVGIGCCALGILAVIGDGSAAAAQSPLIPAAYAGRQPGNASTATPARRSHRCARSRRPSIARRPRGGAATST